MPPIWLHVTSADQPILTEEQCALLNNNEHLISFLRYVLVRDKVRRPTLEEVSWRFEHMYNKLFPEPQAGLRSPNSILVNRFLSTDDASKPHLPFDMIKTSDTYRTATPIPAAVHK